MNEKLKNAKIFITVNHPFFASILLSTELKVIEMSDNATAAVDGINIYFNKKWLEDPNTKKTEVIAVYLHELYHIVLDHIARGYNKYQLVWNIATDAVINQYITARHKLPLPEGCVSLSALGLEPSRNYTAEFIYEQLKKNIKEFKAQIEAEGEGEGSGKKDPKGFDTHIYPTTKKEAEKVHNNSRALVTAAERSQGSAPGHLKDELKKLHEELIDWRTLLYRYLSQIPMNYSYMRPNKKYFQTFGYYLPSVEKSEYLENIVLAVDTSGSISKTELENFASEVYGIVKQWREFEFWLMQCDAKVHMCEKISDVGTLKTHLSKALGGGGTDFRPVFKKLKEENIEPHLLIFFTDGYGTFPQEVPTYPTLWIGWNHIDVPFGDFIEYAKK